MKHMKGYYKRYSGYRKTIEMRIHMRMWLIKIIIKDGQRFKNLYIDDDLELLNR